MNFSYIKKMRELGLLSSLSNDKCDMCMELKSLKRTCISIMKEEILVSQFSSKDLGDLKQTMIEGAKNKPCILSFINDLFTNQDATGEKF